MIVWNGPCRGRERVRVSRDPAEAGGAVLEHDPGPGRDDARAERAVDALDQRHGHAVAVDDAEVGRPAAGQRDAKIDRPIRPHERPAGGEPLVREQVGRQRAVVHERVRVGERELHRLDLEVQAPARGRRRARARGAPRRPGRSAAARRPRPRDRCAAAARPTPSGGRGDRPRRARSRRRSRPRPRRRRARRALPRRSGAGSARARAARYRSPDGGRRPRRVSGPRPLVGDAGAYRRRRRRAASAAGRDGAVETEPSEPLREVGPEAHRAGHGHRAWPVVLRGPAVRARPASGRSR